MLLVSRSKKAPIWTDNKGKKKRKNVANRKVRRAAKLSSGSSYKKVHESWDICDYKFYDSSPKGTKGHWKARRK